MRALLQCAPLEQRAQGNPLDAVLARRHAPAAPTSLSAPKHTPPPLLLTAAPFAARPRAGVKSNTRVQEDQTIRKLQRLSDQLTLQCLEHESAGRVLLAELRRLARPELQRCLVALDTLGHPELADYVNLNLHLPPSAEELLNRASASARAAVRPPPPPPPAPPAAPPRPQLLPRHDHGLGEIFRWAGGADLLLRSFFGRK